MVLC
jgi:hypothetical protein